MSPHQLGSRQGFQSWVGNDSVRKEVHVVWYSLWPYHKTTVLETKPWRTNYLLYFTFFYFFHTIAAYYRRWFMENWILVTMGGFTEEMVKERAINNTGMNLAIGKKQQCFRSLWHLLLCGGVTPYQIRMCSRKARTSVSLQEDKEHIDLEETMFLVIYLFFKTVVRLTFSLILSSWARLVNILYTEICYN